MTTFPRHSSSLVKNCTRCNNCIFSLDYITNNEYTWLVQQHKKTESPRHEAGDAGLGRNPLLRESWNPYIVGAGIGIVSWLAFLLVNKPMGMSTEVSKFSGWVAAVFVGMDTVGDNAYWSEKLPKFGYSTVFLICTAVGAFISAVSSKSFRIEKVPAVWEARFGGSVAKRYAMAFVGGFIILFGARLAGGCTSGHAISGSLQLAASGWLFFAVMVVSGVITARLIFKNTQ
ncbi:MAG: YeeE/YedE family protein [Akkermansiaceae bacterium]|nr:YeeE/YedE family protein [Akkermansiaceae bacterium]